MGLLMYFYQMIHYDGKPKSDTREVSIVGA